MFPDRRGITIKSSIEYDIETTPLQVRTWGDNDGSQLWIKFNGAQSSDYFTMSFKFNDFSVWLNPNCHGTYIPIYVLNFEIECYINHCHNGKSLPNT